MPGSLGVIFELQRAATRPGEAICVTGARAEMGSWRPLPQDLEEEVRSLRTSPAMYPSWASRTPIYLELGPQPGAELQLEYKFVRDMRGLTEWSHRQAHWEAHISNRRVSLPAEEGSFWLVSHGCWGCDWDAPQVVRLSKDDVSRLAALGTDWAARRPSAAEPSRSLRGMPSRVAVTPRTVAAMVLPVAPELQRSDFQDRVYFMMTPRTREEDTTDSPAVWSIEAEFSNFSQPQSGSDEEVTTEEEDDAREELALLREENERLRAGMAELRAEMEQVVMENATLRESLERGSADGQNQQKTADPPSLLGRVSQLAHTVLEKAEGGNLKKDSEREFHPEQRITRIYA